MVVEIERVGAVETLIWVGTKTSHTLTAANKTESCSFVDIVGAICTFEAVEAG